MTSQWEDAVLNMVAASQHMYCSFSKSEHRPLSFRQKLFSMIFYKKILLEVENSVRSMFIHSLRLKAT